MASVRLPLIVVGLALALVIPLGVGLTSQEHAPSLPALVHGAAATERAVFVGNNWDGTADVLKFDSLAGTLTRIARLNIVPDLEARMAEILRDPVRLGYFLAIREAIGEGHDQLVDDMYSTNDGQLLIVSRPSLRDVVAIDLPTGAIAWRFVVDGQRSDHMGLAPNGSRIAVSASTGNVVHVLDTATGQEVGRFASGDSPHENTYSPDGNRIYHASIGTVYTPADEPQLDSSKGARYFQVVDANTHQILKRLDMGQKLAEAGYPGMSAAVRPMALAPDEHFVYFQVSFFHGFVEYDLVQDKVTRVAELPDLAQDRVALPWGLPEAAVDMPREQYILDSAHHGIALDAAGTKLCVAGTMDDYAAIVARSDFSIVSLLQKEEGARSYWVTNSDDGEHCFISWSGLDSVAVISYATGQEITSLGVGDHPQRIRTGNVRSDWVQSQAS